MKPAVHKAFAINFSRSVSAENRWLPSRVNSFSELKQSTSAHTIAIAPQLPSNNPLIPTQANKNADGIALQQHEDCLQLNICRPIKGENLPVMVWIHGGGFQVGSGALPEYEPTQLVETGKVVVVSINYRLGCLGFLRLCDLTEDNISATGNEGLDDQICALQWIKQHIHHYHGDANNITLFGESAGAMSIACLLASPKANTLFHKAILQSGAAHTYSSINKANAVAKAFLASVKALGHSKDSVAYLPTTELMQVQAHFLAQPQIYQQFGILPFTPVVGTETLPIAPHLAIAQGCASHIQIISGSNSDEWAFFAAMLKQNIDDEPTLNGYLGAHIDANKISAFKAWAADNIAVRDHNGTSTEGFQGILNEIYTQFWFTEPCHRLLAAHAKSGGTGYAYRLGRRSPIAKLGCAHAADIGFVFGTCEQKFHGTGPRVKKLIEDIQSAWTHFAHTGAPIALAEKWPVYSQECHYLDIGHTKTQVLQYRESTEDLWRTLDDETLAAF